jgi:hypothetical protein
MTTINTYGAFAVIESTLTDKSTVYAVHFTADSGEPIVIDCISETDALELAERLDQRSTHIAVAYRGAPDPSAVDVTIEQVYGREVIRPANDRARLLASLAGTKTITRDALEHVKALGFKVRDVTPRAAL